MPESKAQPEATGRTPRMRNSAVQRKSSRLLERQRGLRLDRREVRMLSLHVSPMVYLGGARRGGAAGPEQRRQGQDQGTGAREQGVAHRQRDPEEDVGLFCPGGARPPVPHMISFIKEHREACGVEPFRCVLPIAPST